MIKEVLKEELLAEFKAIPPIEELEKMYTFSERHEKQMEAIFADLRKREKREKRWQIVRKVAIIVIAVLAVALASVKFVPEVYAYVKEWLMELTDDESIEFRGNGTGRSAEDGEVISVEFGYVPDGYELESEVHTKTGVGQVYYKNSNGMNIILHYDRVSAADLIAINTEGTTVEEVIVDEVLYYVFECEDRKTTLVWEDEGYMFEVSGSIDKAQLLDMASSLTYTIAK